MVWKGVICLIAFQIPRFSAWIYKNTETLCANQNKYLFVYIKNEVLEEQQKLKRGPHIKYFSICSFWQQYTATASKLLLFRSSFYLQKYKKGLYKHFEDAF